MGARTVTGLAALSVCVAAAWLGPEDRENRRVAPSRTAPYPTVSGQERTGGSSLPCAAPLSWRVARVDQEFGLTRDEAAAAIRAAGGLWEEVVGRGLFRQDPTDGFPIRFVYDHRQARAEERERRVAELEDRRARIESDRRELERRVADHERDRTRHEERVGDFDLRASEHNATVRLWNERGGAPEDVARALRAAGEALEAERVTLERRGRVLERRARAIQDEEERLEREVEEHTRLVDELEESIPSGSVEWGAYRESVRIGGGRASASREIRIYRFPDRSTLVAIVAHELGHALGVGHIGGSEALMGEEYHRTYGSATLPRLTPSDIEALRARCPQLFQEAAGDVGDRHL